MNELISFLVFALISVSSAEKVRYDNYTVYRITPNNQDAVQTLLEWENTRFREFNFWTSIKDVGHHVDVMVPPHLKSYMSQMALKNIFNIEVMMENVQQKIDKTRVGTPSDAGAFGWTEYHTLAEINAWLKLLATTYPKVVSLIQAGESFEKRPLLGIKVSFKNVSQKAVFIESNIHGREWISSATSTYILNEILTSKNESVRAIVESHDWYIFPVVNPDGFEYTHTTDRLWRKTRKPYGICEGADPNRNWDYKWGTVGASGIPCSPSYRGPEAFSEACTKALSHFISGIAKDMIAYISLQSYSQYLLLPYGTSRNHLDNYDQMYDVAEKARDVLARRYRTVYDIGNFAELLYLASGVSTDWVKSVYHTPMVFTYELRDQGHYAFLLPADQIIPTGEETFDSLLTILEEGEK